MTQSKAILKKVGKNANVIMSKKVKEEGELWASNENY